MQTKIGDDLSLAFAYYNFTAYIQWISCKKHPKPLVLNIFSIKTIFWDEKLDKQNLKEKVVIGDFIKKRFQY